MQTVQHKKCFAKDFCAVFSRNSNFYMPTIHPLDKIDRKLLNLLQKNNQMPTRMLADRLHISQPTCLRRMRELRASGIISADVAMVDPFGLGYGMLAFLEISLNNQSDEQMQMFEQRLARESEVMQCYFVSGDYDYFVIAHVLDMDAYYRFVRRVISSPGDVRHFQSRFPMKRAKFDTRIVFDEKATEITVRQPV